MQKASSSAESRLTGNDKEINARMNHIQKEEKLDPQSLFEMVAKSYDSWSHALGKQFKNEGDEFSPFPNEDKEVQKPIFNYNLLEALERASTEFSRDSDGLRREIDSNDDIQKKEEEISERKAASLAAELIASKFQKDLSLDTEQVQTSTSNEKQMVKSDIKQILQEQEINFLQEKIFQVFRNNETLKEMMNNVKNTDVTIDNNQDDYDIDEIQDSLFNEYRPTHHIEVELNSNADGSTRTIFNNECDYDENDGPSCEFTFEYDHTGKLIPTYNNVEEKLRMMTLRSEGKTQKNLQDLQHDITNESHSKKNKKKKKKKKSIEDDSCNHDCCLLCEYEAIYGQRPKQMIKWYDQTVRKEISRREEIRRKIETAKSVALRKQREQRERIQQDISYEVEEAQNLRQMIGEEAEPFNNIKDTDEKNINGDRIKEIQ